MKKRKKLSLKDEINKEAEQIERLVKAEKGLDDIRVSENMEKSLFNKIQEYEYDKRAKQIVRHRRKRTRILVALAAVLVLAAGSVMTGVGSKSYWKVLWGDLNKDGKNSGIDVEDMDSQNTEDIDEVGAYKELNKVLGNSVVRLGYRPENMFIENYTIDQEQRIGYLFYEYKNQLIKYSMYMNDSDSSFGKKDLDDLIDEYEIMNEKNNISVEVYKIDGIKERRYIAEFVYKDVHYQLKGVMEKEEFDKILKNLLFL